MSARKMNCEQALEWIYKMCENGDDFNGHEVDFGGNCESCFIGQALTAKDEEVKR